MNSEEERKDEALKLVEELGRARAIEKIARGEWSGIDAGALIDQRVAARIHEIAKPPHIEKPERSGGDD